MRCLSIPRSITVSIARATTWVTVCAALLASACSSDSQPTLLDAGTGADGAVQASCLIPGDYGALGDKTGTADATIQNSLSLTLDAGPPRDSLLLRLNAGTGAFAGGAPKAGEFSLTGADASFGTCGVCVSIVADIVPSQGPTKFYFATGGKVTLTAVTPAGANTKSTIVGSATNLQFIEVDLAGAPVSSTCTSKIASISFKP